MLNRRINRLWIALTSIVAAMVSAGCALGPDRAALERARSNLAMSNLHAIGRAMDQYVFDHNNTYPPMDTEAHFEAALTPYVTVSDPHALFVDPVTHAPIVVRSTMSSVSASPFAATGLTVIATEPVPHDGMIMTLYDDGHSKGVPTGDRPDDPGTIAGHAAGSAVGS